MYPAASHNWKKAALVAVVFTVVTIVTMLVIVLGCQYVLARIRMPALKPYSHALAGATIAICGVAITLFNL